MGVNGWNLEDCEEECDTCDSKNDKTPVMCAYAYAREGGIELFTIGFFNCCSVVPFIDNTTNKPLFCAKRVVVFGKTSRRFV